MSSFSGLQSNIAAFWYNRVLTRGSLFANFRFALSACCGVSPLGGGWASLRGLSLFLQSLG